MLKKALGLFLALTFLLASIPAGNTVLALDHAPFEGKIAIVTNTVVLNEEEYYSAVAIQERYGANKVIHKVLPDNWPIEHEIIISTLKEIAQDKEVKVLILNHAAYNIGYAVEMFRRLRDDVFIVCCAPMEDPAVIAASTDLVLILDEPTRGESIVMQAKAMGAETFVFYSFPRHMSVMVLNALREVMTNTCNREGLEFIDLTCIDPAAEYGVGGAQEYIYQDVPKQVAKFGKNTAFFSTADSLQIPLLTQVIETGAIYPQSSNPSPYYGYTDALGIEDKVSVQDIKQVINVTTDELQGKGMLGRVATTPLPAGMLWTYAAAEYGIKWINGEVPRKHGEIDVEALNKIMEDCIAEHTGINGVGASLSTSIKTSWWDFQDMKYSHFVLAVPDIWVYGSKPSADSIPVPAPTAVPTASTVYVNGNQVNFEAYLIDGNNYFKLRDLAVALKETNKQFEVGYDSKTSAVTLTSGKPYTAVGGELVKGDGQAKPYTSNEMLLYIDGKKVEMTSYVIGGNNFVKLRDVMRIFDINVSYNENTDRIELDTNIEYGE